jgi:hypothetical protein
MTELENGIFIELIIRFVGYPDLNLKLPLNKTIEDVEEEVFFFSFSLYAYVVIYFFLLLI